MYVLRAYLDEIRPQHITQPDIAEGCGDGDRSRHLHIS